MAGKRSRSKRLGRAQLVDGRAEVFELDAAVALVVHGEAVLDEDHLRRLVLHAELLFEPALALRRLAPLYKAIEADMERAFWGSRFAVPSAPPILVP